MGIGGWILSAVLFIVALASLIVIHELGHFSMAKLFGVYCSEFSIGFGPALLHKRKEGKETYISIRAIPLGGYVSMYGEGDDELEPGLKLPPERSIEGIKKWKKAIVLSAGIVLNAFLAFILIFISNMCPVITSTTTMAVQENSLAYEAGLRTDDCVAILPEAKDTKKLISVNNSFYIIDDKVVIDGEHYVLTYHPTNLKKNSQFGDGLILYSGVTEEEMKNNDDLNPYFKNWYLDGTNTQEDLIVKESITYYPDFTKDDYLTAYVIENNKKEQPETSVSFEAQISYYKYVFDNEKQEYINEETLSVAPITITSSNLKNWDNNGLSFANAKLKISFKNRIKYTFSDYGSGAILIFKGLASIFKNGITQLGGIISIFTTSATLVETSTAGVYLYYWGVISLNLAIFNLLPFPGLDGWQLVVTAIEGISKKKIPTKAKTIMSFIGLSLLMLLMVVVVVLDILRLVGVAL